MVKVHPLDTGSAMLQRHVAPPLQSHVCNMTKNTAKDQDVSFSICLPSSPELSASAAEYLGILVSVCS